VSLEQAASMPTAASAKRVKRRVFIVCPFRAVWWGVPAFAFRKPP
jgi:hypothetical protein